MAKNSKIILLLLLVVAAVISISLSGDFWRSDKIIDSLPEEAELIDVYRQGWGGNGDYVYAMKANMSLSQFEEFARAHGLSNEVVDPTMVIGYNPANLDIPKTAGIDWNEPSQPEKKYYKMNKRSFVRAVYAGGTSYYYSRGW